MALSYFQRSMDDWPQLRSLWSPAYQTPKVVISLISDVPIIRLRSDPYTTTLKYTYLKKIMHSHEPICTINSTIKR